MNPIDIQQVALPADANGTRHPTSSPRRARTRELFLCGPIPWELIVRASGPGKCLLVYLLVRMLGGIQRRATVKLTASWRAQAQIDRHATRRALVELEARGLVQVERGPGRAPLVTAVDLGRRTLLPTSPTHETNERLEVAE